MSYSIMEVGIAVTIRLFNEIIKLNGVSAVATGLITDNNFGTHYLFISNAMIVSDVLMKMRLGKKREL